MPDDENSADDFDDEFAPRTIFSERLERSIRQRRRRTAGTDRPVASTSSGTTRKATKRKKTTAKRKTKKKTATKRKKTTTRKKAAASGGARATPKRRRRTKRKSKTKGKGKGKGKSSAKSAGEKRSKKGSSSLSESGPSLSLFGDKYDLDFHGDDEENDRLYPAPSTSFDRPPGPGQNHAPAPEVKGQERRNEAGGVANSSSPNMLLSSILTSQRATFGSGSGHRGEKMKEVYARPREEERSSGTKRSWSAANSSCSSEDSSKENSAKKINISVRVRTAITVYGRTHAPSLCFIHFSPHTISSTRLKNPPQATTSCPTERIAKVRRDPTLKTAAGAAARWKTPRVLRWCATRHMPSRPRPHQRSSTSSTVPRRVPFTDLASSFNRHRAHIPHQNRRRP